MLDLVRRVVSGSILSVVLTRDATRGRLVRVLLNQGCVDAPAAHAMTAFELHRALTVVETFTLGEGQSDVQATLWTPATVACFRQKPDVRIVAIAVNDASDYRTAACLGIDAVLADSPSKLVPIKEGIALPLRCQQVDAADGKAPGLSVRAQNISSPSLWTSPPDNALHSAPLSLWRPRPGRSLPCERPA